MHSTLILETTKEDIIENLTAIIRIENNQTADRNEQIPPPDNGSEEVRDLQTLDIKVYQFGTQLIVTQ